MIIADGRPRGRNKTEKKCNDCGLIFPIDTFPPKRSAYDGRCSYCRPCKRVRARDYGRKKSQRQVRAPRPKGKDVSGQLKLNRHIPNGTITLEQYTQWLEAQNGRCAICKQVDTIRLSIDHDHVTGKIRGLLCKRCNLGLGWFRDNTQHLQAAVQYLTRHQE